MKKIVQGKLPNILTSTSDALSHIIAFIGMGIALFLSLFACVYTTQMYTADELTGVVKDSIVQNALIFLLVLALLGFIAKFATKLSSKVIHIVALIFSVLVVGISLILVHGSNTYSVSDQLFIYLSSVDMYEGDFAVEGFGDYFRTYPFQLCLVNIYAFFFRIFGSTAPQILENIQAICLGVAFYTGFRITRELFQDVRTDCLYLLCTLPFVPMYLYTLFLYGETFGVCGSLLAIYFFLLANKKWKHSPKLALLLWALTTVFLVFTVLVRSALMIVVIALVIVQFLLFLKKRQVLPLVLSLAMLVLTLLGRQFLVGMAERDAELEVGGGAPASLWVVMGLQNSEMGPGYYNGYNTEVFTQYNYDAELANEQAMNDIATILGNWMQHPKDFLLFLKDKGLYQWCEPSYASFTVTRFMNEPKEWIYKFYWEEAHDRAYVFLDRYQSIAYLLILTVFASLCSKKKDAYTLLPGLVLIGGFLFSLIWEGKSRYVYPYMVIVMPYLAKGALLYVEQATCILRRIYNIIHTKISK